MVAKGRVFAALVKRQNPAIQLTYCCLHSEARPVVRLQDLEGKIYFRGQDFCFYIVYLKQIFSRHNRAEGTWEALTIEVFSKRIARNAERLYPYCQLF